MQLIGRFALVSFLALGSCNTSTKAPPAPTPNRTSAPPVAAVSGAPQPSVDAGGTKQSPGAQLTAKAVALPGATGPLTLDYLVCDRARRRVWVPVGNTGSVDVFDPTTDTFTRVDGFKTEEREVRGQKRMMGPSAATIGDGQVYVGDRATSEVCAVDMKGMKRGRCLKLPTPTDGVAYIASAKEVWVTTPKDQSLTVLDAAKPDTLKPKLVIKTPGAVEGYAIDEAHGLFYTNLEDKNQTLAVEIKSHSIKASWSAGCGEDGPRGVSVDSARNFVFVACTESVRILDGAHDGALLAKLDTGAGVDNLDYVDSLNLLYIAAGKAERLTVARIDAKGQASVIATGTTGARARNAVADAEGNAYVADPTGARLLIFGAPR